MPSINETNTCIPTVTIWGNRENSVSINCLTTPVATVANCGIASRIPCAREVIINGALSSIAAAIVLINSTACGIICETVSMTEVTPLFISSLAPLFPATRSEKPSVI